jgi:hypothetical protein
VSAIRWLDRLSARDRRALVLGFVVLTPVLVWTAVVRPYREALAVTRDRIASERALLAREQRLIAEADELPAKVLNAQAESDRAAGRLVNAPNPALAEARVSDHLERLAEDSRVLLQEIRSVQTDPATEIAGLRTIRLGIRGESDLNGVTTMLHRMEGGQLLLRVQAMQIEPLMERPRAVSRSRNTQIAAPRPTGVVQFQLVIEAYAPTEPASQTAGRPEALP